MSVISCFPGSAAERAYTRPADWLAIPAFDNTKDEIYVLMAVYACDWNPIAFSFTGAYTVDWGDGTTGSFAANTVAEHNYNWAAALAATLTDGGYRQIRLRIYANRGQITGIDFCKRHSAYAGGEIGTQILEINGDVSGIGALTLRGNTMQNPIRHNMMEIFSLRGNIACESMDFLFCGCARLQSVPVLDTSAVNSMEYMFAACWCLEAVPPLDFSGVRSLYFTFRDCYSLKNVSAMDTGNATSMTGMFANCRMLKSVGMIDTSSALETDSMFEGCSSLYSIPAFNMASVQNTYCMFSGCYALKAVPAFDLSSVYLIREMFRNCGSLQRLPEINTVSAEDMQSLFQGCYSLQEIPLLDLSSLPILVNTFLNCYSLRKLTFVQGSVRENVSLENCYALSALQLNAIFGQLADLTGKNRQTINVKGCMGAATCNTALATAKNWSVITA